MDDVGYLKSKGVLAEQSFTFFVDSSMRDKDVHPTPGDYYIPFLSPVRNCFAVELLDASIPRTEYTIESTTNKLAWATDDSCTPTEAIRKGTYKELLIPPGDYNLPQLIQKMNDLLETSGVTPKLRVDPVTTPFEISNKVRFSRAAPFSLFMGSSTARAILGFGNPATAPGDSIGFDGPRFAAATEACYGNIASNTFHSVVSQLSNTTMAYVGPLPIPLDDYTEPINSVRSLRQVFTAEDTGYLTTVTFAGVCTVQQTVTVTVGTSSADVLAVPGTDTFTAEFPDNLDPDAVLLTKGQTYEVAFSTSESSGFSLYVADVLSDTPDRIEVTNGLSWSTLSSSQSLCCDLTVVYNDYIVEAPGPVNLTGARFVLIRSPDIESQISRDRAFEPTSSGLGLCKLSGSGYRDMRFDFSSFKQRSFHPVNLQGIRVRLEKSNGEVYDTHGVDHTLLFLVKFYAGSGGGFNVPPQSVANPNYTPDLRQMLLDKWQSELDKHF